MTVSKTKVYGGESEVKPDNTIFSIGGLAYFAILFIIVNEIAIEYGYRR